VQYVVALDKNTGKIRWKESRKGRMAYTTPLLVEVDGQVQLVSSGGDAVIGYEPATGKEICSKFAISSCRDRSSPQA
jgi:outer membrane protein assembly factor BamB